MSSSGELMHAVNSAEPQRMALDVLRCMSTAYNIDSYQQSYFVIDSFEQLFDLTAPDFAPLYAQLKDIKVIEPGAPQQEDTLIPL